MIDPRSSATIGFHLFIEPSGLLAARLGATIKRLADEYGGPVFPPHVTLLARIEGGEREAIAASQALAEKIAPFALTLGASAMEDAFFRALYLRIQETDEMALRHALANAAFFMKDESAYVPHLSLLYGNYDMAQKEKTAAAAGLASLAGASFTVDKIHLYRTEGEAEQWAKIAEFPLRGWERMIE